MCVIYIAVGVEGAKYDEACTVDGDCKETNAAKCDSGTSKCICSDSFFRKTTATECAANRTKKTKTKYYLQFTEVALDGTCIVTDSAKDQCSVVNTECRTEGSESKCLCKATHYSDGSACQTRKKPEETCAAHQCVTHATCNTTTNPNKCKCKIGYTATPTTTPTMYKLVDAEILGEEALELKVENIDAFKLKQLELEHELKLKELEIRKEDEFKLKETGK
ncbi:Hypothetical predicted protein [Mytilus galloprovincialis]|uniref:EGF-like domain-containing protein n=1 Tax=Mytilus galloprovincialis TaxID=29158 RepID=A0A8B6EYI2_MYTGA|nr:Hypothetical predicted protein [Mytilus galloprovincialis]